MGNVVTNSSQPNPSVPVTHRSCPDNFIEDINYSPRSSRHPSTEEKRVRFENVAEERSHNVVMVKENRSSASSSGYESKSCSSLDEEQRREDATSPEYGEEEEEVEEEEVHSPIIPVSIEDILTCDECGKKFSRSGLYLAHIRTRSHLGCDMTDISEERSRNSKDDLRSSYQTLRLKSPRAVIKAQADAIRKTKSYNQERDILWISPEKLRPKSARPEHRLLGPLGNSYIHWLTHLERLERLSDESSEGADERSPPSTGESTLC